MGFQLLSYAVSNKMVLHRHSDKYKQFRESKYVHIIYTRAQETSSRLSRRYMQIKT